MTVRVVRPAAYVATLLAAALLTACGTSADRSPAAVATTGAARLTVSDGWVKAADRGEMTAAFGTVGNAGDVRARVTSAYCDCASVTQLHTFATGSGGGGDARMTQKKGGFAVPAHGSITLEPGGDHIMLMDLRQDLRNGDTVVVTITTAHGDHADWTFPVRSFGGAQETYAPDDALVAR